MIRRTEMRIKFPWFTLYGEPKGERVRCFLAMLVHEALHVVRDPHTPGLGYRQTLRYSIGGPPTKHPSGLSSWLLFAEENDFNDNGLPVIDGALLFTFDSISEDRTQGFGSLHKIYRGNAASDEWDLFGGPDVQADIEGLRTDLTTAQSDIGDSQSAITTLQNSLTTTQGDVSDLVSDVSLLDAMPHNPSNMTGTGQFDAALGDVVTVDSIDTGGLVVMLPPAADAAGFVVVKRIDPGSENCILSPALNGDTIDGEANVGNIDENWCIMVWSPGPNGPGGDPATDWQIINYYHSGDI